jgi:hypothetical protein
VKPLLILAYLHEESDLCWALEEITGEDPVNVSEGGLGEIVDAWINWGISRGYQL